MTARTRRAAGSDRGARGVLGIDAAWTQMAPSGVALVVEEGDRWRCALLAPSYAAVAAMARGEPWSWESGRVVGSPPDPEGLLRDVKTICPRVKVVVAALDLPLSHAPILRRRAADDAMSRALGARGCGTHSPGATRPGPVSRRTVEGFCRSGFRLATCGAPLRGPAMLEVFPHAAVMTLLAARYRVPYKLARAGRYWPGAGRAVRGRRLLTTWRTILGALGRHITGIALPLPRAAASLASLKRYEDALDALVCAWVGVRWLGGDAEAYGDDEAAIWTVRDPRPALTRRSRLAYDAWGERRR